VLYINQLTFTNEQQYQVVTAMMSTEGEKVDLGNALKIRGNVEDWLSALEARMKKVVKDGLYHGFMVSVLFKFS
jgi:dynein heavy chain